MLERTLKNLKLIYWSCVIIMLTAFVLDVLYAGRYTTKYAQLLQSTELERWGIIITLGGIFASLKLLHPRLKSEDKINKEMALKKYFTKYIIRLGALISISIFNLMCLHTTVSENFKYLAFISIFALLLCMPNKANIENETNI